MLATRFATDINGTVQMGRNKRKKQKSEAGEKRLCPCAICVPLFRRVHRTNVLKHFLTNGVYKGNQHQPSNEAWPVPAADDPDFLTYLNGKCFQFHCHSHVTSHA